MSTKRFAPRKLLVAATGLASINYVVACHNEPPTSGNLAAPTATATATAEPALVPDAAVMIPIPPTSGNLPAPTASPMLSPSDVSPTTGNLAPPPRRDAGTHR